MPESDRRHPPRWLLAATLVAAAIWIPAQLALPLGRDQGIMGWVAETIRAGGWPYADAWDQKGPLLYLLYAGLFALFGAGARALQLGDLALFALAAAACAGIARRAGAAGTGPLLALVLFLAVRDGYWTYAQPDLWVAYLMVVVAALLLAPTRGRDRAVPAIVGVALGAAILIKPVFAPFALMPLAGWAAADGAAAAARRALIAAAAGSLPLLAALAAFALGGRLDALLAVHLDFNLAAHLVRQERDWTQWSIAVLLPLVAPRGEVAIGAMNLAAIAGARTLWRRDRAVGAVLIAGWIAGWSAALVQNKFWLYHLAPAYAFSALLAGLALADWLGWRAGAGPRGRVVATAIAVGLGLAAWPQAATAWRYWGALAGVVPAASRAQSFCQVDLCPAELDEAAAALAAAASPGQPILVWGFEAGLHVLAQRPAASRFGFSYPLVGGTPAWREAARAELMRDLARRPPAAIAVESCDDLSIMHRRASSEHLAEFAALARLIETGYRETFRNRCFAVYAVRP